MITLREALTRATSQLHAHPDLRPSALADAALLLTHTLRIERSVLISHPERLLTREDQALYQASVERRLRFEPMQYILGTQEFYGLDFLVTPDVLIPRPETELLVEAVIARLAGTAPLRIVDVGTGSGAIAVALAHALPTAAITAVDLSRPALELAQQNALRNRVAAHIRFLPSDLLAALQAEPPFDCIVSNPPYIAASDAPTLHPQVRDFEPHAALFAGPSGLEVYTRLIPQAHASLVPRGLLALEIGFAQQAAIAALLAGWTALEFLPDLNGIPRCALARRP